MNMNTHLLPNDDGSHTAFLAPSEQQKSVLAAEGFRVQDGRASIEMRVYDHGLNFVCVMTGDDPDAVLSLSNICVPEQLRRRGLARAVLAACVSTFQHAAFGRTIRHQRVHLEGYFTGDGQAFSRAACSGVQPTPADAAIMDARWLRLADRQLRMDTAPVRLR
jgi:hypothetical protein